MANPEFEQLLSVIQKLNAELQLTVERMNRISANPMREGSRSTLEMREEVARLTAELDKANSAMSRFDSLGRKRRGTAGTAPTPDTQTTGPATVIPHPAGATTDDTTGLQRLSTVRNELVGAYQMTALQERAAAIEAKAKLTAQQRAEQERILAIQQSVLSDKKYAKALEYAAQRGFGIENIKGLSNRGTGIDTLQFQKQDTSGATRTMDLYTNPSGRVTPGISNQFRTFGQGVIRDIGELAKWSIALAAVYGPLKKLQELTQVMIENQTKLAEAAIAVSSSFIDQGQIFDVAAEAANRAGEEITGVIDAFTLAYRAAGGTTNEVERLGTATKLLSDSLTLSKLSTLDQATAIDTLAAALRQTSGNLQGGTELLDKWVRVTKVANVDLGTLATGFAVLGDAAESAGIGVDQLNGLVAAIAETGISSGKETANVARAIVSGFQSDQAKKALEELGIAGDDFLKTMQQIYSLRQQGIISNEQFSKLTLALGGGTRRQAAYSTFIENFNRVSEIADASSKASGDAEAALAKQLDTVQTALTRLSNAFEELAQTMGVEGGFLSIIKGGVSAMTALVKVFDGLVSILGKATPAMAAFIATSLILKSRGVGSIQAGISTLVPKTEGALYNDPLRQAAIGLTVDERKRNFTSTNLLGTNLQSGMFQGALVAAIPAILNATNETDKYGKTKAGFDLVGGIGGGIIGTLTGAGPIVGATIGTAIAEAFVNTTIARKTDIFGYGQGVELGAPRKTTDLTTEKARTEALTTAESELYKSIGFGNEAFGKILTAGIEKAVKSGLDELNKTIETRDEKQLRSFINPITNEDLIRKVSLEQAGVTEDIIREAFKSNQQITVAPGRAVYNQASAEAQRQYDVANAAVGAYGEGGAGQITAFSELERQNKERYASIIETIKSNAEVTLGASRLKGDVKGAEYARQSTAISGLDVKALQYYTALGDEIDTLTGGTDDAARAFQVLSEIIATGAADSIPEVTSIVNEIQNLVNLLSDPTLQTEENLKSLGFGNLDEVTKKLQTLRKTGAGLLSDIYDQARLDKIKLPNIVGDYTKPVTAPQQEMIVSRGKQIQEEFYKATGRNAEEIKLMENAIESFETYIVDGGRKVWDSTSGLEERFYNLGRSALEAEGALQELKGFGLEKFDVTRPQLEAAAQQSIQLGNQWAQQFPGFQTQQEDLLAITNDGVAKPIHADFRILALLLEKIVDQNQKQLDGQYNIPEGATFWVPLTAAYYRPKNEGGSLTDQLNTDSLSTAGTDLQLAADMLQKAAMGLGGDQIKKSEQIKIDKYEEATKYGPEGARQEKFLDKEVLSELTAKGVERFRGRTSGRTTEDDKSIMEGKYGRDYTPFIDSIKQALSGLFELFNFSDSTKKNSLLGQSVPTSFATQTQAQNVSPQVNARLELKVDSSTNLLVDGRVLASIITPYLASDLLRMEASQGTISKRYII